MSLSPRLLSNEANRKALESGPGAIVDEVYKLAMMANAGAHQERKPHATDAGRVLTNLTPAQKKALFLYVQADPIRIKTLADQIGRLANTLQKEIWLGADPTIRSAIEECPDRVAHASELLEDLSGLLAANTPASMDAAKDVTAELFSEPFATEAALLDLRKFQGRDYATIQVWWRDDALPALRQDKSLKDVLAFGLSNAQTALLV